MSTVPMPPGIASLPRDERGRPIPWVTGSGPDGEPWLGTNDGLRCAAAIIGRLCGQCGQPLGYWVAFVGDEETVHRREFLEPPMHPECARYAFAVCPYLAHGGYAGTRQRPGVAQVADRGRPDRVALYLTRRYEPLLLAGLPPMAKAAAPRSVEWF